MDGLSVLPQELFDAILQHLDIKTLLFAQRVSHYWKDAITSSPNLQEALFYRPKTSKPIQYTCEWKADKLHYFGPAGNREITAQLPTSPSPDSNPDNYTITSLHPLIPITINPLLTASINYQSLDSSPHKRRGQRLVLTQLNTFLRHSSQTWREMLLTQPPTPSIVALSVDPLIGHPRCDISVVEGGCTLGMLVDRMLEAEGGNEGAAGMGVWHVMFVDTVELRHLAVGEDIVRFVDGQLVPTGAKYNAQSREKVVHPVPPFF